MSADALAFWNNYLHEMLAILTVWLLVALFAGFLWWILKPRGLWDWIRREMK